jgi:hypothetical protein
MVLVERDEHSSGHSSSDCNRISWIVDEEPQNNSPLITLIVHSTTAATPTRQTASGLRLDVAPSSNSGAVISFHQPAPTT